MHFEYDATKEKCPLPLVKLRVILKKMQPSDTCMIQISDKGSIKDIPKLLKEQGFQFNLKQISTATTQIDITTG
ncbi:sulfurtransferase TusA family protein [Thalassotalea sp. LPB0316]|uniref:sulfurtransferase TusA family protein n=1 Tax=Thalassotalea sp. LPB0316 TaxID=2769490 RepID=UPI0018687A12|nr:sulfurtransferase TusA family protein [Thalassotalea sp. LPB0316]QOL25181.1 sulfurtransferase TusA family protein [Thalassotalea sp. LPB0316]